MRARYFPLFFFLFACGDDEPGRTYPGDVDPCAVDVALSSLDERREAPEHFHQPGEFFAWNTAPKEECRANVRISDGPLMDKEVYVTYPTLSEPTVTGEGGIADGKFPVIVFAHANHDGVCSIFERYFSLHNHWASWGAVVFAVDGTDTNCQRGGRQNLQDRSDAQRAALAEARRLNADPESMFFERLDLDRVILAGHSRGGGASLVSAEAEPGIKGVINLQGVDLTAFGFGSATLGDYPVLGMTAGNDVDVNYPYFEPTEDQLGGDYTWVNMNGAIHAYTADTVPLEPDDPPEISRQQQHDLTEYFTTAFMDRVMGLPVKAASAEMDVMSSFEGASFVKEEISEMGVTIRWRWEEEAVWVDDFSGDTLDENLLGGSVVAENLSAEEIATYRPDENPTSGAYAKSYSLRLSADDGGGTYHTRFDPVTVSQGDQVLFRVKGPDSGPIANLEVGLESNGSEVVRFDIEAQVGPVELNNRFTQVVFEFQENTTFDSVLFYANGGQIFVDDLRIITQPVN
ncbi:hypothetical protein FRD01_19675 [Microvenator marinus]|uniref:PET hydrolase/cutinase-like domain-containing protein n=1 Tax=Microvenator marinus TaxID=2600177 RepID=A0A5B8XZH8_9DELT|nr:hypothetical protein [Microvenator marinus]QED29413.1 hypothetical protein FRD01_19675 [Microvenator marinus]